MLVWWCVTVKELPDHHGNNCLGSCSARCCGVHMDLPGHGAPLKRSPTGNHSRPCRPIKTFKDKLFGGSCVIADMFLSAQSWVITILSYSSWNLETPVNITKSAPLVWRMLVARIYEIYIRQHRNHWRPIVPGRFRCEVFSKAFAI